MIERKSHWENVYTRKAATEVSWYQSLPEKSLELIARTGVSPAGRIIDVGGGASTLVDALLAQGFRHVTVLDIAVAALETAKRRIGGRADEVDWLEADITQVELPPVYYDVWHDRAVFHFLIDAADRRSYIDLVERSLKPGGHLIVATFAADGPEKCSGLDVVRYGVEELRAKFAPAFEFVESRDEEHPTPFGTKQRFAYSRFLKACGAAPRSPSSPT